MSNKTKHIAVHVSPEEYEAIKQHAEEAGRSISDWIRRTICIVPKALPIVDAPLPRITKTSGVASTTDAEISPEHREIIQRHQQQTIREFKPYTKADQAGRKPRKTP